MSDVSLPALPVFDPTENVCGNCKFWSPHSTDARGWVGPCRLQSERGLFPPTAPSCNHLARKGTNAVPTPERSERHRAVTRSVAPQIVRRPADPNQVIDLEGLNMTRQELIDIVREAAGEPEAPPLAGKWEGGVIQMIPGKADLQAKELPIDALFHKVVMVRDRLRTLEMKLNAHPKLTDAEKVELQAYITRVYGSLTSFNHLFREKSDQFIGREERGLTLTPPRARPRAAARPAAAPGGARSSPCPRAPGASRRSAGS